LVRLQVSTRRRATPTDEALSTVAQQWSAADFSLEGEMKRCCWKAVAMGCCLLSGVGSVESVVFFSSGDPQYNTTAPTGSLADSGWHLQGDASPGVPIAPNFFITATHVGGKSGDVFTFRGTEYRMTVQFEHPDADITIWQVEGAFPQYAQIYTLNDEVGKQLVVFGRGIKRGEEVRLNGMLKGWAWGGSDGILRWGENVVAGISDIEGRPATADTKFQLLRADFDPNGGPNEAHLAGGDSGGGVFIQDHDGVWKLAGITRAANHQYSTTELGEAFDATLFDESGYYEGEAGKREYHPDDPSLSQPGSFFATRLSIYVPWIESIITGSNSPIHLQEATNLLGPYTPVSNAAIDAATQTITIQRPSGTRFYRVTGDRPMMIEGMRQEGEQVVLLYR
jgi:hypothetical protein